MKRILFALLCVACTGTAWAQAPMPNQPTGTVQQVSGGRIFAGPACGAPACGTPACAPACGTPACAPACAPVCAAPKTICVPEPAIAIHKKITYSSECGQVCFPKCTLGRDCNSCDQGQCEGHPYQKNYLVKRVTVTECPTTKCVPVQVSGCNSCTGTVYQSSAVSTPTRMEPARMPQAK
jgi:hypothetical protein